MVILQDMSPKSPSVDKLVSDALMGSLKTLMQTTPDVSGHRLEYTVVNKSEEYEERWYPASTWACITVNGLYQDTAKIEGFRHLQDYAKGQNSADAQLSIQPPILTRVSSEGGGGFERKFMVCTYLSGSHTDKLPVPTNSSVHIEHLPEMTVFVSRFQGIACEEKWTYETKRLAEILSHKEDIRTDFYITATYDSPFQLVSNRNEIWFVKIDRRKTKVQQKCLKYGSQTVEIPSLFSWMLSLVLAYLAFLASVVKTAVRTLTIVRDNWDSIGNRLQAAGLILWNGISLSSLFRTGLSVLLTFWKLALAVITGFVDVSARTEWPSARKTTEWPKEKRHAKRALF